MDSMHMSSTMSGGMTMSTAAANSSSMMDSMMGGMMFTQDGYMFMDMKAMAMTFFTATYTPLYSLAWLPTTTGQYAGTCIFLIVLAFVFRFLIALRSNLKFVVGAYMQKHDTDILRAGEGESSEDEGPNKGALKREASTVPSVRPWRVNDALVWASVDTAIAGVSYLLMIAVMTMNVGYFMSVLGGTFLGSFVVGRWASAAGH